MILPNLWAWKSSVALVALFCASGNAQARDAARLQIDVSATTLPEAIAELSNETGVSIGAEGALPPAPVHPVHGHLSIAKALARMLADSGFVALQVGPTAWRIQRKLRQPAKSAAPLPPSSQPVIAADSAPVPIIVTANKRKLRLDELPMAVSVVMPDSARTSGAGTGTEWIAGAVEGLALGGQGPGRNRMFLRGVSDSPFNGESQSTVAVLLDDARLTYSAPDPDIRMVDIERVEVLKGPQGSLYGTGALGGIYHIVTRRADLEQPSLVTSLGSEAVRGGGIGYMASAIANLPIVQNRMALRLVGYSANEPGWIDSGARENGNSSRVLGLRAGLRAETASGWRLDLTGFAQWLDARDSEYVYSKGARQREAQLAEPHDNDLRHAALRLTRQLGSADLLLSSAMTAHDVDDRADATVGASGFGISDPQLLNDDRRYRVWDNETRLSGKTGSLGWLVGVSHIDARQTIAQTLVGASPAAELAVDNDRRITSETALFGDFNLQLLDGIKLELGARLFHSVVKETRVLPGTNASSEQRRNGLTPSAALSWQPRQGRLFFLRYGSAYRQGANEITADGQTASLQGDELSTIEAGWREETSGGGHFDIGAHLTWWENLQSDMLQPDGLIETENAGNAQIVGAEASFEQAVSPGWTLAIGAALEHASLTQNMLGFRLDDRRLPVVPKYTLRTSLRHDFRLGSAAARLTAQLRYTGPARLSFDPLLDRPMGNILESRLEGHASFGTVDLGLALENVFNRKGDRFAFGNPLRFATMRQFTPQPPPSLSIQVVKRF